MGPQEGQIEQQGRPQRLPQIWTFPDIMEETPQKPAPTRREEITDLLSHQAKSELSLKDKKNVADWLKDRYNKILGTASDSGIKQNDLIETYAAERWSDGTKFLRADRKMLKRVAEHFNQIALAGKSEQEIEQDDIEALRGGAKVTRTEVDATSTFPDGSYSRRKTNGDLLKKGADGSLSFHATGVDVELPANGQGYLKMAIKNQFVPAGQVVETKLTKDSNGIWTGEVAGSEMQLAIDEHSVRITTEDMDMLLTTKGGFVRDPSDPLSGATYINPDGSLTMTERDGRTADIAQSKDGILLAQVNDGSREVQYPLNIILTNDGQGNIRINSGTMIPNIVSAADGELTVRQNDKTVSAKPAEDGTSTVKLESGLVVTRAKDSNINVHFPIRCDDCDPDVEIAVDFTFGPDGTLSVKTPAGDNLTFHPPEIKRPHNKY